MDILKILTEFLFKDGNVSALEPVFNLLKENSFDVKKTVANLSPEKLAPIIEEFVKNAENKTPSYKKDGEIFGVAPVSDIADKDIVYTLNKYLGG